jgi:hypothetical protein
MRGSRGKQDRQRSLSGQAPGDHYLRRNAKGERRTPKTRSSKKV